MVRPSHDDVEHLRCIGWVNPYAFGWQRPIGLNRNPVRVVAILRRKEHSRPTELPFRFVRNDQRISALCSVVRYLEAVTPSGWYC